MPLNAAALPEPDANVRSTEMPAGALELDSAEQPGERYYFSLPREIEVSAFYESAHLYARPGAGR